MKTISVVGSTGSIGTQTLKVAQQRGFAVSALSAYRNAELLYQQACAFRPRVVALYDEAQAEVLRARLAGSGITVLSGVEGVCRAAAEESADIVLNAAVGIAGLRPTVAALQAGKTLALANKESLVCAGELVTRLAREKQVTILPVDSEHCAVFQCLQSGKAREVEKIILTASGGPFFGKTRQELEQVTAQQALKHPNWSMGAKITIDSATMMNKAFEVVEAKYLFDLQPQQIDVVVHRESIVHSMVQFVDGAIIAQLSRPDMCLPIQYALDYPDRMAANIERLDIVKTFTLTFNPPDKTAFPALELGYDILRTGGSLGAAVNGANEACVALFLQGRLSLCGIDRMVRQAAESVPFYAAPTLEEIFAVDQMARDYIAQHVK